MGAPPEPLRFAGFDRGAGSSFDEDLPLVRVAGAGVEGRLAPTDLELRAGDRVLVEGPNGAGKSTLLAVLAGELRPDGGTVERQGTVVVARLAQDDSWPDLSCTAEAAYRSRRRWRGRVVPVRPGAG